MRFAFSAVNSINASKSRTLASFLRLQSKVKMDPVHIQG